MRSKYIMPSFIAISLLILHVTFFYPLSLKDLKEKASTLINDDSVQKFMPGVVVALGLAGGLYYYLMNKKNEENIDIKNEEEKNIDIDQIIKQFQVYSQFNTDGGGAASCGYHTLLRSMQLVRSKYNKEDEDELKKDLMNSSPIKVYFGANGEWRKQIIQLRKDEKLKELLHEKFMSLFTKNCDEKSKTLYSSALKALENVVVGIFKKPALNTEVYEFDDQAIQVYLKKPLKALTTQENKDLIEKLQKIETIQSCFNLEEMRKNILSKEALLDLPTLIKQVENDPNLQHDFKGEWLDDDEIKYLWQENKDEIVPIKASCILTTIGDFDLVDHPKSNPNIPQEEDYFSNVDPVKNFIKDNQNQLLNKKEQFFAIFALGNMKQLGDKDRTSGHWYPLVMHQNNGERKYYIMDSNKNQDRTRDRNAHKVIKLIENNKEQDLNLDQ
ncbi:MAG TPA: hypothetical protein VLB80_00270 [Candidatus Babeliales bacterium]|nr:hypothetical protein [Candidatus Babeliales bacterium]